MKSVGRGDGDRADLQGSASRKGPAAAGGRPYGWVVGQRRRRPARTDARVGAHRAPPADAGARFQIKRASLGGAVLAERTGGSIPWFLAQMRTGASGVRSRRRQDARTQPPPDAGR
jgi:hypothetical protein